MRTDELGREFVLASLLTAYPEQTFAENVGVLLQDHVREAFPSEALAKSFAEVRTNVIRALETKDGVDELRSEYIDLFDRGRQVNSLYETEYGRERTLVKGNELVDISGFYRAFGFETGGEGVLPEMVDHVAVELEFYALMILKSQMLSESGDVEGADIVLDGRKKFLKSHLGRFIGAIGERPGVSGSPYYSALYRYCKELVAEECKSLGVVVEPERWISADPEAAAITCGGSVGCVK